MAATRRGRKNLFSRKDSDGYFKFSKPKFSAISNKGFDPPIIKSDRNDELIGCSYKVRDVTPNAKTKLEERSISPKQSRLCSPRRENEDDSPRRTQKNNTKLHVDGRLVPSTEPKYSFHWPSFILGAILSFIVICSTPSVEQYASKFFDLCKIGIVWGVLIGGILWYQGIIRLEETNIIYDMWDIIKGHFLEKRKMNNSDNVENYSNILARENVRGRNSLDREIGSAAKKLKAYSLRSTVDTHKFQNSPDIGNTEAKSQPTLAKSFSVDPRDPGAIDITSNRKNSSNSLELQKTKRYQSTSSNELIDSSKSRLSGKKPLVGILEELPFISEVKLINEKDDRQSLFSAKGIARLETMLSKKSILSTRANYDAFISNVSGTDID